MSRQIKQRDIIRVIDRLPSTIKLKELKAGRHWQLKLDIDIEPDQTIGITLTQARTPSGNVSLEQSVVKNIKTKLLHEHGIRISIERD